MIGIRTTPLENPKLNTQSIHKILSCFVWQEFTTLGKIRKENLEHLKYCTTEEDQLMKYIHNRKEANNDQRMTMLTQQVDDLSWLEAKKIMT